MAAPAVEATAATALRSVIRRARKAAEHVGRDPERVRVVAVSKTKPVSLIRQIYDAGHRCFGENYVQEFIDKAPQLPEDIEWHFVGHLQSNKAKTLLAKVPNLAMVEGVDGEKVANHLDRAVSSLGRHPLKVLVQVNTSGEACEYITTEFSSRKLISFSGFIQWLSVCLFLKTDAAKSGIEPSSVVELARHVKMHCPNLVFSGLMTIGMPDYTSTPQNFRTLTNCRADVCKALGMSEDQFELSMGMSGDFEQAIEMGSTNVRVGSTIFGPRDYPKKPT
ncbi:pyridoxal phosphate homeostasis protein isoform X1 [Eutrema salsugineum]|uniref:pyridoxal phosphate homeostasis protein isoform X1 n=1 Tax=Eutrema salsugineum TaxID=72664 RepID=UPI000CED0E0E|nr:pyridoxal phosphate homeostasis protein isoform X1 [Eutrema salsugineum]XP_024005123.1 pyridoxal phosphate homeostasis protein isoform X1 [Eutrema salsugineum]